jgi:hypothetical protein
MRLIVAAVIALAAPMTAHAWERLTTADGSQIEGDITQPEIVLTESTGGGEVVIPRAALERLRKVGDGLEALLKDGTVITGNLEEKLEIEDGLVRRRYMESDIESVEFDRYIDIQPGKKYHSCPIRIDLDASRAVLSESGADSTALPGAVNCRELRILSLAFTRKGRLRAGKQISVTVQVAISVPEGADQLMELSLELVQGDATIATVRKRLTVDEGEAAILPLTVDFASDRLDTAGSAPRFLVQLVSQDSSQKVERGGFFWWFTIPLG